MCAMPMTSTVSGAHVGDWVEARGLPGQSSRRGQIVELLGGAGHEHYRVRWDEKHESILYPADGVVIIPPHDARVRPKKIQARGASRPRATRSGG
jgi:Domain of unknown function (DUF1918)